MIRYMTRLCIAQVGPLPKGGRLDITKITYKRKKTFKKYKTIKHQKSENGSQVYMYMKRDRKVGPPTGA